MRSRTRIGRVLALALAVLLLSSTAAFADRATFDRVSAAYANNAGQLDPCSFSQADLESALAGIPPEFESVVPDLRRAIETGIEAHRGGDCRGIEPTGGTTTAPGAATTPTTPPAGTETSAVPPPTTTPSATPPAAGAPAQVTTTPGVQPPATKRDSRPLVVVAVALGALALLALLLWGWARLRGWDPAWAARMRHAWGEAGYRVTSTWSEFTDWLRLGR